MRVCVSWAGKDNIISYDPRTARKQVKGTLCCFETEFPLSPKPGFVPEYSLGIHLKASSASRLIKMVACAGSEGKRSCSRERLFVKAPLPPRVVAVRSSVWT